MKWKKMIALALTGVMALALLTGCSGGTSKAAKVEACFRSIVEEELKPVGSLRKDTTLDAKLAGIARQFQPGWVESYEDSKTQKTRYRLTETAKTSLKNGLNDYLQYNGHTWGNVWLCYTEAQSGKSAQELAQSLYDNECDVVDLGGSQGGDVTGEYVFAVAATPRTSDGHSYYVALIVYKAKAKQS